MRNELAQKLKSSTQSDVPSFEDWRMTAEFKVISGMSSIDDEGVHRILLCRKGSTKLQNQCCPVLGQCRRT